MKQVSPDWYKDFFGAEWFGLATQQFTPEQTLAQVDFVVKAASLLPGASILDLCCGTLTASCLPIIMLESTNKPF